MNIHNIINMTKCTANTNTHIQSVALTHHNGPLSKLKLGVRRVEEVSFEGGTKGEMRSRVTKIERQRIPMKRALIGESAETERLCVVKRLGENPSVMRRS